MKLVKASPRREQGSEVRKLNEISGCEAPPPDVWVCKECAQSVHSWLSHSAPHVLILSCSVVSDSLWPYELQSSRFLCPWDSPGKNTGVGCRAFLRGSFWPRDQTRISCGSCIGRRTSLPLSLLRSPPLSPTEHQTVTQSDPEARLLGHLLAMPLWASYLTTLCLSFFIHNTVIVVLVATYPVGLL